jgi:hypothetical protein
MANSLLPDHIGNISVSTDKDGIERRWEIVDEIKRVQSNASHIALYLQKLEPVEHDGSIELRFCYYYAIDEGGWGFAKNPPMMPTSDFFIMASEAIEKGWGELKGR